MGTRVLAFAALASTACAFATLDLRTISPPAEVTLAAQTDYEEFRGLQPPPVDPPVEEERCAGQEEDGYLELCEGPYGTETSSCRAQACVRDTPVNPNLSCEYVSTKWWQPKIKKYIPAVGEVDWKIVDDVPVACNLFMICETGTTDGSKFCLGGTSLGEIEDGAVPSVGVGCIAELPPDVQGERGCRACQLDPMTYAEIPVEGGYIDNPGIIRMKTKKVDCDED